jgi:ATP-binding cassette subfamily F protein 3
LESPDSGSFHFNPVNLRLGYLPQGGNLPEEMTFAECVQKIQGDLPALTLRLEMLSQKISSGISPLPLQDEYDRLLKKIEGAMAAKSRTAALLNSFGLESLPGSLKLAGLSGGQKTRFNLVGLLLQDPQLLLLDEPTNHLDPAMLEWLENWIKQSRCGIVIVSHDRAFLDRVIHTIFELDGKTHELRTYSGNYSSYQDQKEEENEHLWQDYTDQQEEIRHLTEAARHVRSIAKFRKGGKADTGDKFAKAYFANRGLQTVKRAKNIEARVEKLLNEYHIDKPRGSWAMKMEFADVTESSRNVLVLDHLTIGYGNSPILEDLNGVIRYGERITLSGENGCGKTTLLRTIAGFLPALSGNCRLGPGAIAGFLTQEQENLQLEQNALDTLQRTRTMPETEARTYLHKYLFADDEVFTAVRNLSWGQRVRLSLACLVISGCNFLLLDEPLNHLDISSRAQFEHALGDFDGTVMAVTHDRYFIDRFANRKWLIKNGALREVA